MNLFSPVMLLLSFLSLPPFLPPSFSSSSSLNFFSLFPLVFLSFFLSFFFFFKGLPTWNKSNRKLVLFNLVNLGVCKHSFSGSAAGSKQTHFPECVQG